MEEPGAGVCGGENLLRGAEDAVPAFTAPEPGGWSGDHSDICIAPELRLSAEVHENNGGDFAVGLVDPVSASLDQRRCQTGKEKGSIPEQRVMDVEEEKGGSLVPAPQNSAEPGSLRTCHQATGGLSNRTLYAPCVEAVCSNDAGCVYGMLDKATEESQFKQESFTGIRGNSGDVAEVVKTSIEDLHIDSDEAYHNNEGLLDPMNHASEQEPQGVESAVDTNDVLKQEGTVPNVEAVSRSAHEDSVPSVSGSIDLSLDGKAGQFCRISGDSVTGHVANRVVSNNGLCAFLGKGYQCVNAGSMYDIPDTATDRSPCEQDSLAGYGHVSSGVADVKTNLEDLQIHCKEPHSGGEGLPDLVNRDIERLPCIHVDKNSLDPGKHHSDKFIRGADSLTLITGSNHVLEKVDFLPNIDAAASNAVYAASVPSTYGISIDVSLVGQAGDTSENSVCLEKMACDSLGGDMQLCDSVCQTDGDGHQHSGPCADKKLQQISLKYGTSELSLERNLCISLYNQPCNDECSGRESSALFLGHQDSAIGGSSRLSHLEQGLNASTDGKASSVDFVSNSNDESQKTLFVFRRRNPKRAASSRNLNSEKPDQINKASSGSRKFKKVDMASSIHHSNMSMFPNKISKGRSGMKRPQKSSTWGSLKELLGGFRQSYEPSTSNSQQTCLETGRSDNRSDHKSQPSFRKIRSSRSSKRKCSALSGIESATHELKERQTFSTVADTDASINIHRENIPKLSSDTSINIFDSTNGTAESTDGNHSVTDAQQCRRGLASSTKETCATYIPGECAKLSNSEPPLSNANGTAMVHVGFSPDSVLEVSSVTFEGNGSANHDVILHDNSMDAGILNGCGHDPSILYTSNFGKEQVSSLMNLEQLAKTAVGNENTGKEETGPSYTMIDNDIGEGKLQALQKSNRMRKNSIARKPGCKKKDGSKGRKMNATGSTKVSPCEASKLSTFSYDSNLPGPSELLDRTVPPEFGACFEALNSGTQNLGVHEHDSIESCSVMDGDKGSSLDNMKPPRCNKKDANAGNKGTTQNPHQKGKGRKKNIANDTSLDHGHFSLASAELTASRMNQQSNLCPASDFASKNSGTISDLPGNVCKMDGASVPLPPRAAWVCCDDCQKWRCIPAELADVIGEKNCRWTCKDNQDKALAGCSIPQEKTNAEINAELELSDVSADEAEDDGSNSKACRAPSWTPIRSNLFLHRNRRTQSIDESMVCNCKPPQDGRMGCRDGCLNRMLNIECVKRTCPCGEQCSNQKFQRRSYSKLRWFRSGNKGYGLQLQEDVYEGRFLIEYVGEVLDITSYESRQRYYAAKGQKHFYFMALNGGEVIDACTKGNLGRFINHSCSPNCRTEKWMVNGEVCIGIFSMRNIKKGEELTFDYNYVRVSGAAPQKCFCATVKCRGYIGGDIPVVDATTQGDAVATHFEQMVVDKNSEDLIGSNGSGSDSNQPNILEPDFSIKGEDLNDYSDAKEELELIDQTGTTLFETSELENSLEAWSSQEDEDVTHTPVHVSRTIDSSLQQFPVHGTQSSDFSQKIPNRMEGSKAPNVMNGSTPSSDFRSNVVPGFSANKRNNLKQHRNKKLPSSSPIENEHILGVEGRLNNLLDKDGGISKRKDATNGYLKLLLVTAAEGDNAGGSSNSVRDLSLILDALLKTKSRSVLLDIINKNGLQMLHNILKQNRSDFLRRPIMRKLLKVLEFLALKEILTSEHTNGGPRCAGVESFRDSMLSLTRHKDIQVHQIARNFRDNWIFLNIARSEPAEYPHASTFAQDIQGTKMVYSSARRKRKSRWDYQPDDHYKMAGLKIQKAYSGHGESDVKFDLMRNKFQRNQGTNNDYNVVPGTGSSTQGAEEEVPPGFESQQKYHPAKLPSGCEVAPGFCMERYQPSLSISCGIHVGLVQHFGTPESGGGQCQQRWNIAPGVPFPPLPPYPRGSPCPSTSSPQMFHNSSGHCGRTADQDGRVHRIWRNGPRTKWPYNHQGKRFSTNHYRFERFEPTKPQ